jgi:hypothetical protein
MFLHNLLDVLLQIVNKMGLQKICGPLPSNGRCLFRCHFLVIAVYILLSDREQKLKVAH